MRKMTRRFLWLAVLGVLTLLTEIGGLALVATLLARRIQCGGRRLAAGSALFVATYAALTFWAVPLTAPLFGRVALPCAAGDGAPVGALNLVSCVLNRRYVEPELRELALALGRDLQRRDPSLQLLYLDAGFPFLDWFPMMPHLSHRSGESLDLAFFYRDPDGSRASPPSLIGYWAFEQPRQDEPQSCADKVWWLTLRWDMNWLQRLWPKRQLDEANTRMMLDWLAKHGRDYGLRKVLIEPHLIRRFNLEDPIFRFQGCRAARHDDHVHLQLGPNSLH